MKFMGSKRRMLKNGLGELIKEKSKDANRVVDPFCGSGVVAWYAAKHTDKKVIASDLQKFAKILAEAVLKREEPLSEDQLESLSEEWFDKAKNKFEEYDFSKKALDHSDSRDDKEFEEWYKDAQKICEEANDDLTVTSAYGGYYYSPTQALLIDSLRNTLPKNVEIENSETIALASLIAAASSCANSPGHTAQPLRPTEKGKEYIEGFWNRDPLKHIERELSDNFNGYYASSEKGEAKVEDVFNQVEAGKDNDLYIFDPPYSSVQYSRFYHVLETIARDEISEVKWKGRYPPRDERPQSDFCKKSKSKNALEKLLSTASENNLKVIFTFPTGESSNGLSGEDIVGTADEYFDSVDDGTEVQTNFSTMGGDKDHRPARQDKDELILFMENQ